MAEVYARAGFSRLSPIARFGFAADDVCFNGETDGAYQSRLPSSVFLGIWSPPSAAGLAFADALHLRGHKRNRLPAALALLLRTDLAGSAKWEGEVFSSAG
jgi:hypothetical protein